jgi:hypothetical protein
MFDFLLKRKIKKTLHHSNRGKVYHNLKEVKSMLVLLDATDYDDVSYFVHQMIDMGKDVKTVAYKNDKDVNTYSEINAILTPKALKDWKTKNLNPVVDMIENVSFDLVVDFNFRKNLLLQYILVQANSSFKVGFCKNDLLMHDMLILPASDNHEYFSVKESAKQFIYYLTTISSGK